jgi:ABC-type glycerol-3-phosphate transport system permease component
MFDFIGLVDSIFSLILIYSVFHIPLTIWLVSIYLQTIPKSYCEMGFVDGLSEWQVFQEIIFPFAKPAIFASALLNFIFSWNEFLYALVLTGFKSKTLPVLATGFITQRGIIWGQLTATAIIIAIPIIIITILGHKYFLKGVSFTLK